MATYLVMKNNLKRTFANKFTYLVMLLVPIAISFAGIVSGSFSNADIRVGVIGNTKELTEVSEAFSVYPTVHVEIAKQESMHTDLITGTYQYLIDMTANNHDTVQNDTVQNDTVQNDTVQNDAVQNDAVQTNVEESISTIIAAVQQKQESKASEISQTDRTFALLLTAYMIIASIYATTMIQDKKNKTMERFCFAGFTKTSYSIGYMASTALIICCQLISAVVILAVFNHGFVVSLEKAVEIVLFMTAVASIFGVGIASFLKSELSANITASSIVVILSLLGGTFVSISQMPEILKCISVISPIRWLQLLL